MMLWKEEVAQSAGFFANDTWLEKTPATETFNTDSGDVSVWEHVDKIDSPIHTGPVQPP